MTLRGARLQLEPVLAIVDDGQTRAVVQFDIMLRIDCRLIELAIKYIYNIIYIISLSREEEPPVKTEPSNRMREALISRLHQYLRYTTYPDRDLGWSDIA